ncbi:MAG: porin [Kiritimatiellae bacterium]|nr:porin [Kiritimatiellia bacterium]MDD5523003.1 porin [Kiritimatiellia bacterium]
MNQRSIVVSAGLCFALITIGLSAAENKPGDKSWADKIKFSVEDRVRYEYKYDFDFDNNKDDHGDLLFNRLRLNCKIDFNEKNTFFVEGLDGRVYAHDITKPTQTDQFDLHQVYLNFQDLMSLPFDVKVGRQEMKYGKGRLIAAPTWANKITAFDGGILRFKKAGFYSDLFYGQYVPYEEAKFNHSSDDVSIKGIYCGYQESKDTAQYEAYYINNINVAGSNDVKRNTFGARMLVPLFMGLVSDLEGGYQFGDEGPKDVSAYALHADVSRVFADIVWKPKLTVEYNYASGDEDSTDGKINTFVPIYQTTHDPYGVMDFFRWQNMQELGCLLTLEPQKKLKVIQETHCFFLAETSDYWYASSGSKVKSTINSSAGSYTGTEISLVAKYDLAEYLKLEGGYAHFFTGSYLNDVGTDDDADWVYAQVVVKF